MPDEGKRIGIVLTISKYDTLHHLPGCDGDSSAIAALLKATGRFSEIIKNDNRSTSDEIRDFLRAICDRNAKSQIDEIFFYFSGHGVIQEDFIFCTRDYADEKPRSTSIPNPELDGLFRDLQPKLMVKVIDACQSGARLLKDALAFRKSIESKGYQHFIQFASCMDNQSSLADSKISTFTREFIRGCSDRKTEKVLYLDIQNHLVDAFKENENQTPYFISQVTGREVFCEESTLLKGFAESFLETLQLPKDRNQGSEDLKKKLQALEKKYVNQSYVEDLLKRLQEQALQYKLPPSVGEFYTLEVSSESDYSNVPSIRAIAKNIDELKESEEALVSVNYEREQVTSSENLLKTYDLTSLIGGPKYVRVPSSLSPKIKFPCAYVVMKAAPKFRSIDPQGNAMVLVPFRLKCRVFTGPMSFVRAGWDEFRPSRSVKWSYQDFEWSSLTAEVLRDEALKGLPEQLLSYLNNRISTGSTADRPPEQPKVNKDSMQ